MEFGEGIVSLYRVGLHRGGNGCLSIGNGFVAGAQSGPLAVSFYNGFIHHVREGEGILDDGSNLLSLWGDAPLFFFNHHHVYLSLHRGMEVYTEIQGIIFDTRHSRVNFAESLSTCFRALIQWANFWIIPISIERSVTGLYSFRALCSDNSGHDNLFEQIAITACSKFSLVSCIRTLDEMFCFLHYNSIICKFLQFFLFHLILLMVAKDFQTGMSFHRDGIEEEI